MTRTAKKALSLAVGGMWISALAQAPVLAGTDIWQTTGAGNSQDWFGPNWSPSNPGTGDTALFQTNVPPSSTVNIDASTGVGAIISELVNAANTNLTITGTGTTPDVLSLYGQTYTANQASGSVTFNNVILGTVTNKTSPVQTMDIGPGININLMNAVNQIIAATGSASASGQNLEIDGNIADGTSTPASLTILGGGTVSAVQVGKTNTYTGGTVILNGSNTFSGGITIGTADGTQGAALQVNPDTVVLNNDNSLNSITASGTGTVSASKPTNIVVNEQSQILFNDSGSVTNGTFYYGAPNQTLILNGIGENKTNSGAIRTAGLPGTPGVINFIWEGSTVFGSALASEAPNGDVILSPTKVAGVAVVFAGPVTGSGGLDKQGSGTVEFSNPNNNLTGSTLIGNGGVNVDPGSSMGTGDFELFQTSTNFTFTNLNNAAQSIGNLSSAFTATTDVGSPTVDQQNLYLNGPGNGAAGTVLTITQTQSTAFGYGTQPSLTSVINGAGSVVLSAASTGTLTFTGFNTYTGNTTINGGTLNLANGVGQYAPPVQPSEVVFAGSATGSGDVIVNNGGHLITGNNTSVLGATMNSGSIGGNLIVNSGGIVNPGGVNLTGSLSVGGNLTAHAGSILDFDLLGGVIASSDQINVAGALSLDTTGTETINVAGSAIAIGNYTLLNFNSLVNPATTTFTLGSTPVTTNRKYSLIYNSSDTSVILQIQDTGADRFWSVGGKEVNGNPVDGAGTLTVGSGANTFTAPGTNNDPYVNTSSSDFIIGGFGGAGGLITLGSNIRVGGPLALGPVSSPYTIGVAGGANTLDVAGGINGSASDTINAPLILEGSQSITASSGTTLTLNGNVSEISGPSVLTKSDLGTVVLNGTGTYTGGTVITQGTLQTTTFGLPATGGVSVATGANLDFVSPANSSYAGLISGSGTVVVTNTGTIATTLTNTASTYTGATNVAGGVLTVTNVKELGTGAVGIFLSGGTLQAGAASLDFPSVKSANVLQLLVNTSSTIDTQAFNLELDQVVEGAGNLTKIGSGTLTFTNLKSTNVIGNLAITGGAVNLQETGNPSFGFSASTTATNAFTGDLNINAATDLRLYGGNISGGGNVNVNVNGAVLEGRAGPASSLTTIGNAVNFNIAGTSTTNIEAALTTVLNFAGPITGVAGATLDFTGGTGVVILSGKSTYLGPTTIDESAGGEVQLGSNTGLSSVSPLTITKTGVLDVFGYSPTLYSITSTSAGNTGQILNEAATPSIVTIATNGGGPLTYSGILEDGGFANGGGTLGLTLNDTGTASLTLTGNNDTNNGELNGPVGMTGPVLIEGGRIDLKGLVPDGNNGTLTALGAPASITVGANAGNSQLRFDGDTGTIGYSSTNGVGVNPSTTVVPPANVTYILNGLGGFTPTSGIADPGAISVENTSVVTLPNNVTLNAVSGIQIDTTSSLTISGNVTGAGGIVLTGGGPLTLAGSNNFTGGAAVLTAAALNIKGNTTVGNTAQTGAITGTASLTVGGTTPVTLTLASASGASSVSSLTITPGSTLDLTNNSLAINSATPVADAAQVALVRGYLTSGYGADTWTGTGIDSSKASTNPGLFAVGYADGNTDKGTPATANQIIVMTTLAGDSNLDGIVNFPDLLVVAQNFGKTGQDWAQGDFNYDGIVNFPDLLLIAQNFGKQLATSQLDQLPGSFAAEWQLAEVEIHTAGPSSVPEPATTSLLAVGVAGLLARRRRRNIA